MKKMSALLLAALFCGSITSMAQVPAAKVKPAKVIRTSASHSGGCADCPHAGQADCDKKPGSEGTKFVDFSAVYNGKTTKLSDYVGKGKYVLVDFWASWCGPCRRELPNLISVYNKYKGKKFEVLGVATWDEPANTLRAIEQEKIPYPQMLNAQKAGSDAYDIQGIPEIILFGPDGTILKRGLRGAAIEEAVKQYVK